jgi:hypothetical protein
MKWWRNKAYACPVCGWQGMAEPIPPLKESDCPECGARMMPLPWLQTWGVTILILGIVVGTVLFVAYVGDSR